jgi:hypothetical protein
MKTIKPYANDADSLGIGELTVENGTDCVVLYGSIDLTRDRQGLEHARALKALLDQVIQELEAYKKLPDRIAPPEPPQTANNPFS